MTAGEDVAQFVITLTGYTGIQRDVLKTLIRVTGAECTDALTKKNTHLLCNNPTSKKAVAAAQWGIRVVNHLWIMDSVLTWAWQPAEKYDRAGEDIIEEGGWTLLGDSSAHAKSLHSRFLSEKTWPLPAAQIEEDAQIASRTLLRKRKRPAMGGMGDEDEDEEEDDEKGAEDDYYDHDDDHDDDDASDEGAADSRPAQQKPACAQDQAKEVGAAGAQDQAKEVGRPVRLRTMTTIFAVCAWMHQSNLCLGLVDTCAFVKRASAR
jgi:hypothetical protein